MKKIKVTEKSGRVWEYLNDGELIDRLHLFGHGLPERWVPHKDEGGEYDEADVLDERIVELSPAIDAVVNDANEIVQEAIPAKTRKEVKLRAEYTFEIIDISAQVALENCMAARKAEYPTPEEFMNAFFDGGESAVAALQAKRLAIKQKYPKP
jgi:hypothetical protein